MASGRSSANQIRGPRSALTDFLASNNISAAQIQIDFQRRQRQAAERERRDSANEDGEVEAIPEESSEQKKRKRREAAVVAKIKRSKEFARRKARSGEPDGDDLETALEAMYQKSQPLPGQLENCELCSKRFTVTPYTKTGPDGDLLCTKCSKELVNEEKKSKTAKRGPRSGRRQNQSNLLDGHAQRGAPSLVEMCTKKVADSINDVEEFGDLPKPLLLRLSQILSKRRALTSRTLRLFLRPDLDSIDVYDCAKLDSDDFETIFAFMPSLVHVNLRFAGQMKDKVMQYMMDRNSSIKHLQLDAANLVSDACWRQLFQTLGPRLESLKLSNLDYSLDDETVKVMATHCTNLRRLKLKECWKPGDDSLCAIADLSNLEHLSLEFIQETKGDNIVHVIEQIGPKLQTLSLQSFHAAEDRLLDVIHRQCRRLSKLRFTGNAVCTDKAYTDLFTHWSNPPLVFVDLSSTRDVDNSHPDGPADPIGLASDGFIALMKHSGSKVRTLNISSCRHISHSAFETVFGSETVYPQLKELDISFQSTVDDYLVNCIFKSCPALKRLTAFACFEARDVHVPVGVALLR
jgi:DNA repair protein RAD7